MVLFRYTEIYEKSNTDEIIGSWIESIQYLFRDRMSNFQSCSNVENYVYILWG